MTGDAFVRRHVGPDDAQIRRMLDALGLKSLTELIERAVPADVRSREGLNLPVALSEAQLLTRARELANQNQIHRSFIGQGYYDTLTPTVILRNILENPGWYTAYTPYQAEISQGRMEALLNYQTMVCDLTGLPIANSSLLDEGTAAAEAMTLVYGQRKNKTARKFWVDPGVYPQTREVLKTRATPLGLELVSGDAFVPGDEFFGAIFQYPDARGVVRDLRAEIASARAAGVRVVVATDLLALCLLTPPGEMDADVAVGSSQRFGVPMGFGGPHAAFLATREEFKRQLPGRIIGVSRDADGRPALRLALQTREQHIRRERATSNICTAQVLLAVMASMYAVYHGPKGLRDIATNVHLRARRLGGALQARGFQLAGDAVFDTVTVLIEGTPRAQILERARAARFNLNQNDSRVLSVALDEVTTDAEVDQLLTIFGGDGAGTDLPELPRALRRTSEYLTHPVFSDHHSETEMLRYIDRLRSKDLSLAQAMIPLGSCTMKLNATTEMIPVTWPEFGRLHPFAPRDQSRGYQTLIGELEKWLAEITGFAGVSLQPNAGSQGEYAGLLVIREYLRRRGETSRDVCLIPASAHGTNPASAVMAGFRVVVVAADPSGSIDMADLRAKVERHQRELACVMITYPSTHGVFEETFGELCRLIHDHGGQVYVDGANMNALVGVARPGRLGADVSHLNLHKTFCIPHGGGGPGVGPIGVGAHLVEFLPKHSVVPEAGPAHGITATTSAPWGSAGILPISWAYIAMMGPDGLRRATEVAILNANYIAHRLGEHFPILYRGPNGMCAHECIIDVRPFKATADVTVDDVAKRLMDYGFHAPTMSWPVAGTMMIEPTESEDLAELDRFCEAMIAIRREIAEIEDGRADRRDNMLKNAPHSMHALTADQWTHPYARTRAGFPLPGVRERKFWIPVARVDNVHGDKNLVCSCPPVDAYA